MTDETNFDAKKFWVRILRKMQEEVGEMSDKEAAIYLSKQYMQVEAITCVMATRYGARSEDGCDADAQTQSILVEVFRGLQALHQPLSRRGAELGLLPIPEFTGEGGR